MSEYFAKEQWVVAQQSVIGSMLLDKRWVPEVLAITRAEDYTQPYRALYLAIQQLTQDGTAIDAVTVLHALDGDAAENRKLVLDLLDLTAYGGQLQGIHGHPPGSGAAQSACGGWGWRWRSARPVTPPGRQRLVFPRRWPPAPARRRSPSRICWGGSMSGTTRKSRCAICLGG